MLFLHDSLDDGTHYFLLFLPIHHDDDGVDVMPAKINEGIAVEGRVKKYCCSLLAVRH